MTTRKFLLSIAWATIFAFAGPVGCGKKEIEQLRAQITTLEAELAGVRTQLEEAREELKEAHTRDSQGEAKEEALTNELVKVKVERDKFKQELSALRKKR